MVNLSVYACIFTGILWIFKKIPQETNTLKPTHTHFPPLTGGADLANTRLDLKSCSLMHAIKSRLTREAETVCKNKLYAPLPGSI